jgi:hypothetical protein
MMCLQDGGTSSAGHSTAKKRQATTRAGTSRTATPTSGAATSDGGMSASSAATAPASTRQATTGASPTPADSADRPSRITAAGRPNGALSVSRTAGGRYLGRLPYGASWDGSFARGLPIVTRTIVDDFGREVIVRRCATCRHWLPLDSFLAKIRNDRGAAIEWESACPPCKRVKQRELYAARNGRSDAQKRRRHERYLEMMADPVRREARRARNRKAAAKARRENPKATRGAQKRYMAKVMADEKAREARNADARITYRLRKAQREETVPMAKPIMAGRGSSASRVDSDVFPALPAGPFVAMIDRLMKRERSRLYQLALVAEGVKVTSKPGEPKGKQETGRRV